MSGNKTLKGKFICPECSRTIFNRRNKRCEFCGAVLPESLLLTRAEMDAIDHERYEADKRRCEIQEQRRSEFAGGDDLTLLSIS